MPVLIDTGPLVALLSQDDARHRECAQVLAELDEPLFTCWPVLTEAAWFLRAHSDWVIRLFTTMEEGSVHLFTLDPGAVVWVAAFLQRYQQLNPQLADACLVYLAEREGLDTIFTLDRRDFSVFRLKGKRSFKIIP